MPNIVEIIKQAAIEANEAAKPMNLLIGVVTSESPLVITLEQRLPLSEEFLILTKHVTDHYVDMTVSHSTATTNIEDHKHSYQGETEETNVDTHVHSGDAGPTGQTTNTGHKHSYQGQTTSGGGGEHGHNYSGRKKILLHYGLKQGESVLLLRMQGGQKYLVLDRIGEVSVKGEWRNDS